MTQATLKSIAWPALAVGTFFLGKFTQSPSSSQREGANPPRVVKTVQPKRELNSSNNGSKIPLGQSLTQLRDTVITVAKVSKEEFNDNFGITSVMKIDDPVQRSTILLSILDNIAPEDFEKVVDDFRQMGITRSRMSEYDQMLYTWAQVDPNGALAYAQENTRSDYAENVILNAWVKTDPGSAIEWAETHHTGEKANPFMVGIIRGMVNTDLDTATELLNQMPYSEKRGEALQYVINTLVEGESEKALSWLNTISDERLKSGATARLVSQLSERDPSSMASWVTKLEDESTRRRSLRELADTWAEKDITEAKDWVSSLTKDDQVAAAGGMIREYARQDASAAAGWINSMSEAEGYQKLLNSFIWSTAFSENPQVALSQVTNLQSEETQRAVYARALGRWASKDPKEVKKWLASNSVPQDIRKRTEDRLKKVLDE